MKLVDDIKFILNEVFKISGNFSKEDINSILDEAYRFASAELAPLNRAGDVQGCKIVNGKVSTPQGFKHAYQLFAQNGWNSIQFSSEYGGQELPLALSYSLLEIWSEANMSFSLAPILTQGASELLSICGDSEQKKKYLPNLISGQCSGTMCLTESAAGSDLGAITTTATKNGEVYLIKGQKIFITYGDHDLTNNIVHMVLAKVNNEAKDIALFMVPKILEDGRENDVKVINIEHKLGIHASPTTSLSFGENNNCVGYLLGKENMGLKNMFIMMNNARLAVAAQGVGVAENSYIKALVYAGERVQGTVVGRSKDEKLPIFYHPSIQRDFLEIRASITAMRLLVLYVARSLDIARNGSNEKERGLHGNIAKLLVPVAKACATDMGFEVSSKSLQIFGGVGYIEETGIAQNLRDARIAMIYEGTNSIQAIDLVKRKTQFVDEFLVEAKKYFPTSRVEKYLNLLTEATKYIQENREIKPAEIEFYSYDYIKLFGLVMGALLIEKYADTAKETGGEEINSRVEIADFYIKNILPRAANFCHT